MKLFPREADRNNATILKDINDSGEIYRDDIHELVKDCSTLAEAEGVVRRFLAPIPGNLKVFKSNKVQAIANIVSDLRSYKDWYEQH